MITTDHPSAGASLVDELLGRMTSGFFVECGAYDGQWESNTLTFEVRAMWSSNPSTVKTAGIISSYYG